MARRKVYCALAVKNELENIDKCIQYFNAQDYEPKELWVCVNQPDDWWQKEDKVEQCINNTKTIEYLFSLKNDSLKVLDFSSKGKGWVGKKEGIGWARKVLMDSIADVAKPEDVILSMDADTAYEKDYYSSVIELYNECPKAMGLLNPYKHQIVEDVDLNRSMLRYELYMRHYTINLWQIASPYAFAAMGSIISCPVWAYKKSGGMIPKKSGEDFYFVQNIIKVGALIRYNKTIVYPGTRYSDRVYFGTGPALIKGQRNDWASYPIYPPKLFRNIKMFYEMLPMLYVKDVDTPLDDFIEKTFGTRNIWGILRENFKSEEQFVRACHAKIDGLRVLQYLKSSHNQSNISDDENFKAFIRRNFEQEANEKGLNVDDFSFWDNKVEVLDKWRDLLFEIESVFQKQHYYKAKNA